MDVYREADRRIKDFMVWVASEFNRVRKKVKKNSNMLALFDELNVLYKNIDRYSRSMFVEIVQEAYDAEITKKRRRFDEEFLIVILDDPNEYTTVTYSKELERRAERFGEQIAAAVTRTLQSEERTNENGVSVPLESELQKMFNKEYNSLALLLDQYEIETVDEAREVAFDDDGVRRVRWVTQLDGRECDYCRSLNGHVFPVKRVPTKPHPRCRCYTIRFD